MKYLLIILLVYVISNAETTDKIREVVDIPFKEASMINSHTEFMGVTIYAKTIDEDTQENYFYEEVEDDGSYPVLLYITNESREKVLVYTKDATLDNLKQKSLRSIIEPYQSSVLTSKAVFATLANISSFGLRMASGGDEMADGHAQSQIEEIRNEFYAKSIKETLLYPGDTILGFMFFDEKQANKNGNINMKIQFMNSLKKYDLKTKVFE